MTAKQVLLGWMWTSLWVCCHLHSWGLGNKGEELEVKAGLRMCLEESLGGFTLHLPPLMYTQQDPAGISWVRALVHGHTCHDSEHFNIIHLSEADVISVVFQRRKRLKAFLKFYKSWTIICYNILYCWLVTGADFGNIVPWARKPAPPHQIFFNFTVTVQWYSCFFMDLLGITILRPLSLVPCAQELPTPP